MTTPRLGLTTRDCSEVWVTLATGEKVGPIWDDDGCELLSVWEVLNCVARGDEFWLPTSQGFIRTSAVVEVFTLEPESSYGEDDEVDPHHPLLRRLTVAFTEAAREGVA